ncbi:MAG: phasin family protein [Xanthomonadales bacterium]|nr:phasin family protein [Xanthomonadales bacterium]
MTMIEQMNAQWMNLGKRFADTAIKAHGLAVEGFEKTLNLNLKAVEDRVEATVGFINDATAARDFEGVKALFPKGLNLAKESAEKFVAVGQELVAVTLKTNESIGALYANDVQLATETFESQAKDVSAKVRKTVK